MTKRTVLAAAIFILTFSTNSHAGTVSLSLKASTLGAGLEVERSFTDSIGARIGFNYFTYDYSAVESSIDYNVDVQLQSFSAMLDWHPFQGSFRISAGALLNQTELDAVSKAASSYTIGDITYTSAQLSSIRAAVDFDDIAPYLGLAWDTSYGKEKTIGFLFELGALYQGKPNVSLTATGAVTSTPGFETELAKEKANIENTLDDHKFYPVVSVGLSYRF